MAPVLASRKDCAVCGMVFSFLHQNRHKMKFCKSCGEGVCHVCSLHKIPLNYTRPEETQETAVSQGARWVSVTSEMRLQYCTGRLVVQLPNVRSLC